MPLQILRNDITKIECDAIVNAARPSLLGGGGVDGAIHAAAGPGLLAECRTLGGCLPGGAKITGGYNLPCRYVIHTVGPVWQGGGMGEREILESCYRASLELALAHGCETVAFPLISAGAYGYPKDQAMRIALEVIGAFLMEHDMTVYLVVYSRSSTELGKKLAADLREYIDDNYVQARPGRKNRREEVLEAKAAVCGCQQSKRREEPEPRPAPTEEDAFLPAASASRPPAVPVTAADAVPTEDLEDRLRQLDESFQQTLLRLIDQRGMSDADCYKKANLDRRLFSKIRGNIHYKPSKRTALAFAVALELDLPGAEALLRKAGYALSDSNMADVIVRYFIERGNYNIFEINEALFAYDQALLGA